MKYSITEFCGYWGVVEKTKHALIQKLVVDTEFSLKQARALAERLEADPDIGADELYEGIV